jgi:uncharacterized protein (TIGR02646 family)
VSRAKARWESTKKDRTPFLDVKTALDAMCWGHRRCCYCEDSLADEIEHHHPKDLYPELVFAWPNYLYACGPCNGPKSSRFAVLPLGATTEIVITRAQRAPVAAPLAGESALLHPRLDDPLDYLTLDIRDMFWFLPSAAEPSAAHARAKYTIELLALNERTYLVEGRRTAYSQLISALRVAKAERDNTPAAAFDDPRRAIRRTSHRSVWEEMRRQRDRVDELRRLFEAVPEALSW